jgi:hypothetical protein
MRGSGWAAATAALVASVAIMAAGASPPVKGKRWTWPKGAEVVVVIHPDFSEPETRLAIASAFRRWEDAGEPARNASGVMFRIASDPPAAGTPFTFVLVPGTVRTGGQARTLITSSWTGVIAARCVVDSRVTDPTALAHVVAHEIGHTFGLAECDACEPGASVMTRFNGDFNDVVTGRGGPSQADDAAVRANGGY